MGLQREGLRRLTASVGAQPSTAIGSTQRHTEPQPLVRTVVTFPSGPAIVVLVTPDPCAQLQGLGPLEAGPAQPVSQLLGGGREGS